MLLQISASRANMTNGEYVRVHTSTAMRIHLNFSFEGLHGNRTISKQILWKIALAL